MSYSKQKKKRCPDPSCCPEPWPLKHLAPFKPDQIAGLEEGCIQFTFSWASNCDCSERIWFGITENLDQTRPLESTALHAYPSPTVPLPSHTTQPLSSSIAETFSIIPPQHNTADKNQGLSVSLPPTADRSIMAGGSKARQSFYPLSTTPSLSCPGPCPGDLSSPSPDPSRLHSF